MSHGSGTLVMLLAMLASCHRAPTVVELSVQQAGTPATAIDERVASLENAVANLPKLVGTESRSRAGVASMRLSFAPGTDLLEARAATMAAIDQRSDLTVVARPPRQARPIRFALKSRQLAYGDVRQLAEMLRVQLLTVAGVAEVDLCAGPVDEIQIRVDLARCEAMGIGLLDIARIFPRLTTARASSGNPSDFVVRGKRPTMNELRAAVIVEGSPTRLADVATITVGAAATGCQAFFDGQPMAVVEVALRPDGVRADIESAVRGKATTLPIGVQLTLLEDPVATFTLRLPPASHELLRAIAGKLSRLASEVPEVRHVLVEVSDEQSSHAQEALVQVAADPSSLEMIVARLLMAPSVALLDVDGPAALRPHSVTIRGPDREALCRLCRPLTDGSGVWSEGLIDSAPQIVHEVDTAAATKLGASADDIEATYGLIDGAVVATIPDRQRVLDVVLRVGDGTVPPYKLSVRGTGGAKVPLSLLVRQKTVNTPTLLLRDHGQPAVRLYWFGPERPKLPPLPPGFSAVWRD